MRAFAAVALLLAGCRTGLTVDSETDAASECGRPSPSPVVELIAGCSLAGDGCTAGCHAEYAYRVGCSLECSFSKKVLIACVPGEACDAVVRCAIDPDYGDFYEFICDRRSHASWTECSPEQIDAVDRLVRGRHVPACDEDP
jgi:hypothetical protein